MGEFLDGGGFGNGGGIGGFGDLLGAEALALVLQLYSILAAVANFIWGVLVAVANFLYNLIHTVGNFLVGIFRDHILPVFRTLVNDYLRLKRFLAPYIAAVKAFILALRFDYVTYILPIITGITDVIQAIRIGLEILRFLHVQWAAKLDADLARIQGYLTESVQLVLGNMNRVVSILGIALDPAMILRRDFWTATMLSNLGALKRAVGFGGGRVLFASEAQAQQDDRQLLDPAHPIAKRDAAGHVTVTPEFASIQANMRTAARDYMLGVAIN